MKNSATLSVNATAANAASRQKARAFAVLRARNKLTDAGEICALGIDWDQKVRVRKCQRNGADNRKLSRR
jgi:hypothetical protein